MRRREFITLLGGVATAWPFGAQAQQTAMPVIGFLRSTSAANSTSFVTSFRQGLKETGFVEGKNVAIEYRYADNQLDRLSVLMADLVRLPAAVIVVNAPAVRVAKAATTTVPIVFVTGADPVKDGLVASLNRPGGNVTGVTFLVGQLGAKRLELLRQLVPKATTIGVLVNPMARQPWPLAVSALRRSNKNLLAVPEDAPLGAPATVGAHPQGPGKPRQANQQPVRSNQIDHRRFQPTQRSFYGQMPWMTVGYPTYD